ncbi:dopamine receptor 2-like [Nematostella vectensis]|uniref:dopamine receptor 2-like n=1 Tax=Nematostella vectensis TaxID=45351 RepID=UPI0020772AA8|nr:dopamine receptor 2-like [Nematostella vectensis]
MQTNETVEQTCWFIVLDRASVELAYTSYVVNIVLNCLFSPPTILLNIMVILAIYQTPPLHSASNILICSLSFSDLLTGLVTKPFYVAYKFSEISGKFEEFCNAGVKIVALVSSYFLAGTSFYTLTVMSLDRCLALHLGLRYRLIVTQCRVVRLVVILWVLAVFTGFLQLWVEAKLFFVVITALMLMCLVTMILAYSKAYIALRKHYRKMTARQKARNLRENVSNVNTSGMNFVDVSNNALPREDQGGNNKRMMENSGEISSEKKFSQGNPQQVKECNYLNAFQLRSLKNSAETRGKAQEKPDRNLRSSGSARADQIRILKYRKSLKALKYLMTIILLCYVPHTYVYVVIVIKGLNVETRAAKNIVNPIYVGLCFCYLCRTNFKFCS